MTEAYHPGSTIGGMFSWIAMYICIYIYIYIECVCLWKTHWFSESRRNILMNMILSGPLRQIQALHGLDELNVAIL